MRERWDCEKKARIAAPEIDAFIEDVLAVCRKHGMSIGHEDSHGAFEIVRRLDAECADWLRNAHIAEPGRTY